MQSLHETSAQALEVAAVATILFLFAAYIEGFISPSNLAYQYKVMTAIGSTAILVGYVFGLGYLPKGWKNRAA